jgi:hypothetical protein
MTRIWGVTMVANEEDIIGYTLSHLFSQGVDGVVVCLHNCTDRTEEIVRDMALRRTIEILLEPKSAFYQGRKLTELANYAHRLGAEWVIPFDADELWYPLDPKLSLYGCLGAATPIMQKRERRVVAATMLNHFTTNADQAEPNPYKRLKFRHVNPNPLQKCCVLWSPTLAVDEGNHRILIESDYSTPSRVNPVDGEEIGIGIRHFSARSEDVWIRKSILAGNRLALTKLDPSIGAHVRQYAGTAAEYGEEALREHYRKWFVFDVSQKPYEGPMVYDPAPYTGDL